MSRNIPHLQEYGRQLLQEFPQIRACRRIGFSNLSLNFDNEVEVEDDDEKEEEEKEHTMINDIKDWIIANLLPRDFPIARTDVIYRETKKQFEMGWHIDDCAVIKHSKNANLINPSNFVSFIAGGKYAIYFKGECEYRPKYTFILYLDTIHRDFEGGVFEFADGQRVEPHEQMYIFFDSREVHKVHRVKSGTRRNLLIKFYGYE